MLPVVKPAVGFGASLSSTRSIKIWFQQKKWQGREPIRVISIDDLIIG